jgi:putative transposase
MIGLGESWMPWKVSNDVMEVRARFVDDWLSETWTIAELCRHYEVTRKTGYKWLERYQAGGIAALADRSRAPKQQANAISEELEERIIGLRGERPLWGARKIRALLEREGEKERPAVSTIGAVLKRNGLTVVRKRKPRAQPNAIPVAAATGANEVWSADFKGWFRTLDGVRCDPLTISDVHSRYLFRCQAVVAADTLHAKPVFEAAFREYGLPLRLRTDNGAPFGSNGDSGLTGLSVWWIQLGIQPERIQPAHPEQNGRHERLHRTLKEATAFPPAPNRRRQQERFDVFRQQYNEERPHAALGQTPPAQHYQSSPRAYPERLAKIEYPSEWQIRQVSQGGQMRWQREHVFVAHALEGQPVGLQPIDDNYWKVFFSFYEIGVLDSKHSKIWNPKQWQKRQQRGNT